MSQRSEFYNEAFQKIIQEGRGSTALITLYEGFDYFRSHIEGRSAIVSYVNTSTAWIGASDPVCAPEDLSVFLKEYFSAAKQAKKSAVILPVSKSVADAARKLGYYAIQIGDEPWFDLDSFAGRQLPVAKQLRNKGAQIQEFVPVNLSANERLELEMITQDWLDDRKMAPLSFLNRLEPWSHVNQKRYFRALFHGQQMGYIAAIPSDGRNAWYLVDIIRSRQSPTGTTELLVIEALNQLKKDGARRVSLGMSPFVPVSKEEHAFHPRAYWLFQKNFERMNFFYGFKSLHAYKEKFHPTSWEPQYLISSERSLNLKIYFGLFQAVFPKGIFHTIASSLARVPRRFGPSKVYRALLNDRIVPRTPPKDFLEALFDFKATLTLMAMNCLFFFTSIDASGRIRDTMIDRYGYSWQNFFTSSWFSSEMNLVIASFLHWNPTHLILNLSLMITFCAFVECMAGSTFLVLCYLLGILFGNPLTSVISYPILQFVAPDLLQAFLIERDVGCSLGIFACIGAFSYFSRYTKAILLSFVVGTAAVALLSSSALSLNHIVALVMGYFFGRKYVASK